MARKRHFHCKSEAQKRAIRRSYARKTAQPKPPASPPVPTIHKTADSVKAPLSDKEYRSMFPKKFPFWAKLKINKHRPTLIIDEEQDDKNKIQFVHREAIHCSEDNKYVLSGDYEKIYPNPDKSDKDPMYLKRPHKHSIKKFEPHNGGLTMPENLRQRYDKNNHKEENPDGGDGDKKT